jgi:hypothetical protein
MMTITKHNFFVLFDEMVFSVLYESEKSDKVNQMMTLTAITLSRTYFISQFLVDLNTTNES